MNLLMKTLLLIAIVSAANCVTAQAQKSPSFPDKNIPWGTILDGYPQAIYCSVVWKDNPESVRILYKFNFEGISEREFGQSGLFSSITYSNRRDVIELEWRKNIRSGFDVPIRFGKEERLGNCIGKTISQLKSMKQTEGNIGKDLRK